jgi:pyruvyl transferase EpsO
VVHTHREAFLSWIEGCIPPGTPVAIMDVPVHRNAGDLFILAVAERLLATRGCRVVHRTGVRDYHVAAARRHIGPHTTLVGLGGGNFGDAYPRYQALREGVVRDFPANRIVVMPQTIHFTATGALDDALRAMGTHQDLHIAVRDHRSRDLASRFTPNVTVLPDIVDVFGGDVPPASEPAPPAGRVVLLRRDREGLQAGRTGGTAVDWPDVFPDLLRRVAVAAAAMTFGARVPGGARSAAWLAYVHQGWRGHAADVFRQGRRWMAAAEHLDTDRLHAAILARLAGRPVTLRDHGYGKLAAYYEQWWKDDPGIELAP